MQLVGSLPLGEGGLGAQGALWHHDLPHQGAGEMGRAFTDCFRMTLYPAVSGHESLVGHRCPPAPNTIIPLPAHHLSAWPGPMPHFGCLHPCPVPVRVAGVPHR